MKADITLKVMLNHEHIFYATECEIVDGWVYAVGVFQSEAWDARRKTYSWPPHNIISIKWLKDAKTED